MTITLRDFITTRDAEIREQIKLLRSEQKELAVARAALDGQGGAAQALASQSLIVTIKDMARTALTDAKDGLTSGGILEVIRAIFNRDIERTSLSPQLSRLKEEGELVLNGERWFTKANYAAWEAELQREEAQRLMEDNAMDIIRADPPEGMFD